MARGMSVGFKVKWTLDLNLIKMDLFTCKAQIKHSTERNMSLIQILYELNPIKFVSTRTNLYTPVEIIVNTKLN